MKMFTGFNYDKVMKDKDAWFIHTLFPKDREAILAKIEGTTGQERSLKAIQ